MKDGCNEVFDSGIIWRNPTLVEKLRCDFSFSCSFAAMKICTSPASISMGNPPVPHFHDERHGNHIKISCSNNLLLVYLIQCLARTSKNPKIFTFSSHLMQHKAPAHREWMHQGTIHAKTRPSFVPVGSYGTAMQFVLQTPNTFPPGRHGLFALSSINTRFSSIFLAVRNKLLLVYAKNDWWVQKSSAKCRAIAIPYFSKIQKSIPIDTTFQKVSLSYHSYF